jgi:integrase
LPPAELPSGAFEAKLFEALAVDVRPAFRFLLLSGWRRGEMIGLRWSDLDLPNRSASSRLKGGRTVRRPLTTAMVALIANQPKATPFVFTYLCQKSRAKRRAGQRYSLTPTLLRDRWQAALATASLPFHLRIHDLRHTLATRLLRTSKNLALVKDALQHRNIATTLRYAHVLDEDTRAALDVAHETAQRHARLINL